MTVTAEERRLIDEAVARGKVRRIPQGVTTLDEIRWDPEVQALRYVDKAEARRALRGAVTGLPQTRPQSRPTPQHILDRRARVAALVRAGQAGPAICAALQMTRGALESDLRALDMRLTDHRACSPAPRALPQEVRDRRSRVRAAFDGQRSVAEIARLLDMPERTVRAHLQALGLKAPDGRKPRAPRDASCERRAA